MNIDPHENDYYDAEEFKTKNYEVVVKSSEFTGHLLSESWFLDGVLHRDEDQPAWRRFAPDSGELVTEEYWKNGKRHRDGDKPAYIHYDPDNEGRIVAVSYYRNNELHRANNLPAVIHYDDDGSIIGEEYHYLGEEISPDDIPNPPSAPRPVGP